MIAMSRPLRFLFCASAAALIFGSEPSPLLAAQAQVADVAAPLPKFRGTHRVRAFHRAPIGAPYNGGIGAASRVGGKGAQRGRRRNQRDRGHRWRVGRGWPGAHAVAIRPRDRRRA